MSRSRSLVHIFTAVALLLVPWLGLSDFHTRGEAREALVAQSMLSSGNWVLPRAYNDALPSKPPLFHWLVAAASIPSGEVSEFTSRLPSALAALGALGFFLVMLGETFSKAGLVLFATILTFSFEWLRAGVSARVDMVHASCLSAGLLSSYFALRDSKLRWWVATTALITLAVLGKGPVAIVIPGIVLTSWICLNSGRKAELLLRVGACLCATLLLSLVWYVSAYVQAPDEFVTKVWYENVSRFIGTMEVVPHNHSVPFLMGMLFVGTLPWSPLVVLVGIATISRPGFSIRRAWQEAPSVVRFSAVAATTVVLFYSVPTSKRGVYLLAAYPFLAIGATEMLRNRMSPAVVKRAFMAGCLLTFAAQVLVLPTMIAPRASERALARLVREAAFPDGRVYSFGYEFYGTAFYCGQPLLRLEDTFGRAGRRPAVNDLVLSPESDMNELEVTLKSEGIDAVLINESSVGKTRVYVFRVL